MTNNSICPQCNNVNELAFGEALIQHIRCTNCHHVYEHINYIPSSVQYDDKMQRLKDMIVGVYFERMSDRTIVCLIIFENGYEIVGKSTVKEKNDFKSIVGKDVAYDNALSKAIIAFGGILGGE